MMAIKKTKSRRRQRSVKNRSSAQANGRSYSSEDILSSPAVALDLAAVGVLHLASAQMEPSQKIFGTM